MAAASLEKSPSLDRYGLRAAFVAFDLKKHFSFGLDSLENFKYNSSNQASKMDRTTGEREKESAAGAEGLSSEVSRRERRDGKMFPGFAIEASLCLQIRTIKSRKECFTSALRSRSSSLSSCNDRQIERPLN